MQLEQDKFYILMEGQPESPEIPFMKRVIKKLIDGGELPSVKYQILEVGGSEVFNSFARLIYNRSNFHQRIPVLAIRDRDFRKEQELEKHRNKTDRELLNNKSVRYLDWERHEWENFLLEETEILAQIFNAIPVRESGRRQKLFKRNSILLTKLQLDTWLQEYFQETVIQELVECLKFRFYSASLCPQLENPRDLDLLDLTTLRNWFKGAIAASCTPEKCQENLRFLDSTFDETLFGGRFPGELDWSNWFNNPRTVDLETAKKHFRGKEAFIFLFKNISDTMDPVPKIKAIDFINNIFLRELENNTNCLLIRQIKIMLSPYFQKAGNMFNV